MKAKVLVVVTSIVLPTVTLKAQLRTTTLTKRAAELTRLDVHPQAKHPRSEGSQMDVRRMTMAGVAVSGLEDENIDGHENVGDLLDRLVDNAETEEATKAKLT